MAQSPPTNAPASPKHATSGKHIYNDDLLVHPKDIAYIEETFPTIAHVLDYPELREVFLRYDAVANAARAKVRHMGFAAVLVATCALLGAATEPIWGHFEAARWVSITLESLALFATLIMVGMLRHNIRKTEWLKSRLMTERLRQWHFQTLVCRQPEIEASCDRNNPGAVEHYRKQRAQWFKTFLHKHEGDEGGKLDSLLEGIDKESGNAERWLHTPCGPSLPDQNNVLAIIHKAYLELRFDHQIGYTNRVLRKHADLPLLEFLKWPVLLQRALLDSFAWTCVQGAFVCSGLIVLYSALAPGDHAVKLAGELHGENPIWTALKEGTLLPILVLCFTIVGVALRTIQEGLGVNKDIERYRAYRNKVTSLRDWFDRTSSAATSHELMKEMEEVVDEELKEFLRAHTETTFVL